MLNTLFSLSKACSEFTRRVGREASMRDETVFLRPNFQYHANPSSDRVCFRRADETEQPKNIVIDPFISFGKAVITGTGVSTDIVAERFKAGESADELASDYGCDREKIEEAIRCELSLAEAA